MFCRCCKISAKSDVRSDDRSTSKNDVKTHKQLSLPKLKSKIVYKLKDEEQWREGTVHSHAGKAKGKHQNRLNVADERGAIQWFDFSKDVAEWEPVCEEILLTSNLAKEYVHIAKHKELDTVAGTQTMLNIF